MGLLSNSKRVFYFSKFQKVVDRHLTPDDLFAAREGLYIDLSEMMIKIFRVKKISPIGFWSKLMKSRLLEVNAEMELLSSQKIKILISNFEPNSIMGAPLNLQKTEN